MKKRFSENQIIDFLKEADRGAAVQDNVPAMADSPGARLKCPNACIRHRGLDVLRAPRPYGPWPALPRHSASRRWSASGARSSFVAAAQVESRESPLLDLKAHLDRPAADGTVLDILGRA